MQLTGAAERAAQTLATDLKIKISQMPTTDTERIMIMARVVELLGGQNTGSNND